MGIVMLGCTVIRGFFAKNRNQQLVYVRVILSVLIRMDVLWEGVMGMGLYLMDKSLIILWYVNMASLIKLNSLQVTDFLPGDASRLPP